MKFRQLTECNTKNIFLKISFRQFGAETIPRLFTKKSKLSISLDQQSKILYNLFILYVRMRAIEMY